MKKFFAAAVPILFLWLFPGPHRPDKLPPLEVMIVSPGAEAETEALCRFLETKGISITRLGWESATQERAEAFDLVIVTGPGRRIDEDGVVLDYAGPVLGLGPYGCRYFGLLDLKNGHPYT